MGKTPDKGMTPGLRYRRKASFGCGRDVGADNQSEHRAPELPDAKATARTKPDQGEPRPEVPDAENPNPNPNRNPSPDGKASGSSEVASGRGKSSRRRKQYQHRTSGSTAGSTSTSASGSGRPSLLKQLMWKAKAVQQPTPLPNPTPDPAPSGGSDVQVPDSRPRPNPNVDADPEEAAERAFAAAERQQRKLAAAKTLAVRCPACPVETSSQETQSGSEDDEPAFLPFVRMVQTDLDLEPETSQSPLSSSFSDAAPDASPDACFPLPFPMEKLDQLDRPSEIVLTDFSFHPEELQVVSGAVVVWRVSPETPGMVEHCLEVVWTPQDAAKPQEKAASGPLAAGEAWAWRFAEDGRAAVRCSVYNAQGVVVVGNDDGKTKAETARARKLKQKPKPKPKPKQKQKAKTNAKIKRSYRKREAWTAPTEGEEEEQEPTYHPPVDRTSAVPSDLAVCREVLAQLEEVAPSAVSSQHVIMIGEVECPVENLMASPSNQEEEDDGVPVVHDEGRPNVPDFQHQVIAMLQRSEQLQLRHRRSFHVENSGFDADAAYDFMKRRYSHLQDQEMGVVYAECVVPARSRGNRRGHNATMTLHELLARLTSG